MADNERDEQDAEPGPRCPECGTATDVRDVHIMPSGRTLYGTYCHECGQGILRAKTEADRVARLERIAAENGERVEDAAEPA